ATGASMRAAVTALSALSVPRRIVVAVPTAPEGAHRGFAGVADEFVCPLPVRDFRAVGNVYRDFGQVSDLVVRSFLEPRQP
ncbi:phosphoribosyltransferase, partial [Kibdelosporangium lantanae]